MSAVAEIAAAQRVANARRTTAALGLLNLLAVFIVVVLKARPGVAVLLTFTAAGQGVSYLLTRVGRSAAGILLSSLCLFVEHAGAVAIENQLGPIPYIAPLVILLVAATAEARWVPVSFVSCLMILGVEGWLSPWAPGDQQAIVTAALFATAVFVVSLLHVRGTERAFDLAERQDRARASAAAEAIDSERRYRLIADSTDDLISLVARDGSILYLSPSHERVLGLNIGRMLAEPVADWLSLENTAAAKEAFARTLERGHAQVELHVHRADGSPRVLEAHMKRVGVDAEVLVAIVSRDVTERRDLEMRLHTAERLDALGRLAGSVAHDFNNLLTVIGGGAELARKALSPEHPAVEDLDAVLGATSTATDLARQLLTFSRRQVLVRAHVGLAAILDAERVLLVRLLGTTVRLDYEFEDNLPAVIMPRAHVEQLALNMAVNARDAMPEGGRLRFALRKRTLAAREVSDLVAGDYVLLEVSDEGAGIPDDILPHLFEPFFSTKGAGGTGLGLATCFGIVAQAGGTITVESAVGRGTTFRVFLPAADTAPTPTAGPPPSGDVRRVLVVDDDASVRETTTRMLRSEGYEVHAAATLADARRVIEDGNIVLDAVLTDVVLGNERGTDLLEPCRRARPGTRIVVTSGYAPDPAASESVATHAARFLSKPFGRNQLLEALRGE